jgi:uncharacterized protein YoxC
VELKKVELTSGDKRCRIHVLTSDRTCFLAIPLSADNVPVASSPREYLELALTLPEEENIKREGEATLVIPDGAVLRGPIAPIVSSNEIPFENHGFRVNQLKIQLDQNGDVIVQHGSRLLVSLPQLGGRLTWREVTPWKESFGNKSFPLKQLVEALRGQPLALELGTSHHPRKYAWLVGRDSALVSHVSSSNNNQSNLNVSWMRVAIHLAARESVHDVTDGNAPGSITTWRLTGILRLERQPVTGIEDPRVAHIRLQPFLDGVSGLDGQTLPLTFGRSGDALIVEGAHSLVSWKRHGNEEPEPELKSAEAACHTRVFASTAVEAVPSTAVGAGNGYRVHRDWARATRAIAQALKPAYLAAVSTLRGRSPVSFVPLMPTILGGKAVAHSILTYRWEVNKGKGLLARLSADPTGRFLGIPVGDATRPKSLTTAQTFKLPLLLTEAGTAAVVTARLRIAPFDIGPADRIDTDLLALKLEGFRINPGVARLGSLDIRFPAQSVDAAQFSLRLNVGLRRFDNDTPPAASIDLRVQTPVANIGLGAQDPKWGFETEEIIQPQPVIVPVNNEADLIRWRGGGDAANARYLTLTAHERASGTGSRVLQLRIETAPDQVDWYGVFDAIVVDPQPFFIARVMAEIEPNRVGNRLIAEYVDRGAGQAQWELATATGTVDLLLGPQAVGETFIKGTQRDVPADGRLDFRFPPGAWLRIARADLEQARVPAPQNLRRILGAGNPGGPGALLRLFDIEWLYGLSAFARLGVDTRIAEVGAIAGRPIRHAAASQHSAVGALELQGDVWSKEAKRFLDSHEQKVSVYERRLAVLHLFRSLADRRSPTLTEGVEHRFRRERRTEHPFRPGEFAVEGLSTGMHNRPLKGGVDRPFESPNLYAAVRRSDQASVRSTISAVALTARGGSAVESAEFDGGKTIVAVRTTLGRTEQLQLIRIGRIAQFWNRARHVIVYERRATQPRRYLRNGEEGGFREGVLDLRKVAEYVELIETERSYPDFPTGTPRHAGPVVASRFPLRIDVCSEWGYDYVYKNDSPGGDFEGFVMPLYRDVDPTLTDLYPVPDIGLRIATSDGRESPPVDRGVANPSVLRFYASTRDTDGADTDAWAPVPGIDFPLLDDPRAPNSEHVDALGVNGNGGPIDLPLSDPPDAEPGFAPYTVLLTPSTQPVDIRHGYGTNSAEVNLSSITFVRSNPAEGRDEGVRVLALELTVALQQCADRCALVAGLVNVTDDSSASDIKGAAIGFLEEAKSAIEEAQRKVADLRKPAPATAAPDWKGIESRGRDRLLQLVTDILASSWSALEGALGRGETAFNQEQKQLLDLVSEAQATALAEVKAFRSAPWQVRRALEGVSDAVRESTRAELTHWAKRASEELATLANNLGGEQRQVQEKALADLHRIKRQLTALKAAIARAAAALPPSFGARVGPYVVAFEEAIKPVHTPIDDAIIAVSRGSEIGEILKRTSNDLKVYSDKNNEKIEKLVQDLDSKVRETLAPLAEALDEASQSVASEADKLDQLIRHAANAARALIHAGFEVASAGYGTAAAKATGDLASAVEALKGKCAEELDSALVKAETVVGQFIKTGSGRFSEAESTLAAMDQRVEGLRDAIQQAAELSRKFPQQIIDEARDLADEIRRDWRAVADLGADVVEAATGGGTLAQRSARTLRAVRALGSAPVGELMSSSRHRIAYYFNGVDARIRTTPVAMLFDRAGQAIGGDSLKGLGIRFPMSELGEQFVADLQAINKAFQSRVRDLLPDLGGLKLEKLFPELKIPGPEQALGGLPWLKIEQGADKERLRAWLRVRVDKQFPDRTPVFSVGPVSLLASQIRLEAKADLEAGLDQETSFKRSGSIRADWTIHVGGLDVVTLKDTRLSYDNAGKLDFDVDPAKIRYDQSLQFLTDAIAAAGVEGNGVTLIPKPTGIRLDLDLPLPDVAGGAVSLANLRLSGNLELKVIPFSIATGWWLARPDRPFTIAVSFLGGGGYLGVDLEYAPDAPDGDGLKAVVTFSVGAGAIAAVAFGPVRGIVAFLLFIEARYAYPSGALTVRVGFLMYGDVRVLSIVSVYIGISYTLTYQAADGSLRGEGWIRVRVRVSRFFRTQVSRKAEITFAGKKRDSGAIDRRAECTAA